MSTVKTKNVQIGADGTASNNFTIYQPSTPDGTSRWAVGVSGATTADVVTVNSSGNVGIGTSSLASNNKLTVDGGRLIVANGPVGAGQTSSTKGVQTYFDATNNIGYIYSTQSGVANYRLSLNGNDIDFNQGQMRIDSSGNVLVGTTSNTPSGGTAKQYNLATGTTVGLGVSVNNTGYSLINFFYNNSTLVGTISTNGTGVTYGTSSDYRLKENIVPMTGALDKVALLKPVTYKWKSDGSDGQGFIAHELQAVVPDCVIGEKDAVETYTDEEGNEQTRPKYQGVDTSFLVATLTAAIQELTKRVQELEAKVN